MAQESLIREGLTGNELDMGKLKMEPTDEFIKVSRYLNVIFAYNGIPLRLVPISLVLAQRMTFKTNIIYLLKPDKEEIAEMMDISFERVKSLLKECVKHDIIRAIARGKYEVNAYLFSTGTTVETRALQAHFDFQKETYVVHAEQRHLLTGEIVRKAVINRKDKQIPGQQNLFENRYLGEEQEDEQPAQSAKSVSKPKKSTRIKNSFNQYQQNDYDYDRLEATLTGENVDWKEDEQ